MNIKQFIRLKNLYIVGVQPHVEGGAQRELHAGAERHTVPGPNVH
jgi:hypothetical protein